MTSVGTEDMSSVAEGGVMLGSQIFFQEPKKHAEEIKEEESWMRNLIRRNIEEESRMRKKERQIMRRKHVGEIKEEESLSRNH